MADIPGLTVNIDYPVNWTDGMGGSLTYQEVDTGPDGGWGYVETWPATPWPQSLPDGILELLDGSSTNVCDPPDLPLEHCDINTTLHYEGCDVNIRRTADTEMSLATGGPPGSRALNLWRISATATGYTNLEDMVGYPIPPEQIQIGSFGNLDANGNLYVVLPDNDADNVAPAVPGNKNNTFTIEAQEYGLVSLTEHEALSNPNLHRTTIGVGEDVQLAVQPFLPAGYVPVWTTSAGSWMSSRLINNPGFTAPSHATNAIISFDLPGVSFPKAFTYKVVEPTGLDHAVIIATNQIGGLAPDHFNAGRAGAEMLVNIFIAPTYVSFYNVQILEVGEDATNVTGYFTNNPPFTTDDLHHRPNPAYTALSASNSWPDYCWEGPLPAPPPARSSGSYTWIVPVEWKVKNDPATNFLTSWSQVFTNDSTGTVKITKYGKWVQRTTNNVITSN